MRRRRATAEVCHEDAGAIYKLPLVLTPQPEGGYTVVCPVLPELITEGDTVAAAVANVQDALAAALELYEDLGKAVPSSLVQTPQTAPLWFEAVVPAA
jgi:antitoxin HicB